MFPVEFFRVLPKFCYFFLFWPWEGLRRHDVKPLRLVLLGLEKSLRVVIMRPESVIDPRALFKRWGSTLGGWLFLWIDWCVIRAFEHLDRCLLISVRLMTAKSWRECQWVGVWPVCINAEVAVSNEDYCVVSSIFVIFLDEAVSRYRLFLIGLHVDIDNGADWYDTPGDPGQLVDECCDEGSLIF